MIFPGSKRETAAKNFRNQIINLKLATGIENLSVIAQQIGGIGEHRLYKLQKHPELMTYGEQYQFSVFFKKHGLDFDPTLGGMT